MPLDELDTAPADLKQIPTHSADTAFRRDAEAVLADVRSSFARLVAAAPGGIRRPVDLQRCLGLDYKLSWQVFTVAHSDDPLDAGRHVPSPASTRRLLSAASERAMPEDVIEAARDATDRFEHLVATHSEDRASFQAMVQSICGDGDGAGPLSLGLRRTAYRTNSSLWGVQVRCYWTAILSIPGSRPGVVNQAAITAKLGLRRLRADASVTVYHCRPADKAREAARALDPSAFERFGAPLLPAFCSQPIPRFHTVHGSNGWDRSELVGSAVGRPGTVDLVFGVSTQDAATVKSGWSRRLGLDSSVGFRTPASLMVTDMLVHKDLLPVEPQAGVFAEPQALSRGLTSPEAPTLPLKPQVAHRRQGVAALDTPDVPHAQEIIRCACERLGWDADAFELYRLRLEYPVLHSVVWMQLDLLELPEAGLRTAPGLRSRQAGR